MKRSLMKVARIGRRLLGISSKTDRWLEVKGDLTLRLDYDLSPDSVVFDVGGYRGEWSQEIYNRYHCNIFIFEPVNAFSQNISKRFINEKKVRIVSSGLGVGNLSTVISLDDDGSSLYTLGENIETIQIIDACDFIKENNIDVIDLMKLNIEGGEYDLLDHLIQSGMVKNIKNIQIQFHDFVPNAKERMSSIQKSLELSHYPTYQFPFVWENWRIKETEY